MGCALLIGSLLILPCVVTSHNKWRTPVAFIACEIMDVEKSTKVKEHAGSNTFGHHARIE
eukprot:1136280-Pelagomonas_calceolata.AAC.7